MGWALKLLAAVGAVALVGVAVGWLALRQGLSAREQPGWLEELLARRVLRMSIPAEAQRATNPYPLADEHLPAARAHWIDHCASCHALDGSGDTLLGRNLYPRAPDLRAPATQQRSDGELFYIIDHGVRHTGMPAWGGEHTAEESWHLVEFIRRLPQLSPEELRQLEEQAARQRAPGHTHGPGTRSHTH